MTATNTQGATVARGLLAETLNSSALSFAIDMPQGGLSALPLCSATIEGIADVTRPP